MPTSYRWTLHHQIFDSNNQYEVSMTWMETDWLSFYDLSVPSAADVRLNDNTQRAHSHPPDSVQLSEVVQSSDSNDDIKHRRLRDLSKRNANELTAACFIAEVLFEATGCRCRTNSHESLETREERPFRTPPKICMFLSFLQWSSDPVSHLYIHEYTANRSC